MEVFVTKAVDNHNTFYIDLKDINKTFQYRTGGCVLALPVQATNEIEAQGIFYKMLFNGDIAIVDDEVR